MSARARQLNHRLKNRRTAIIARRENDATLHSQFPRSLSPWRGVNGHGATNAHSPSGFVAVNAHNRAEPAPTEEHAIPPQFMFSHSNTDNVTIINGTSIKGASPTTRAELMKKFFTTADRQARGLEDGPAAPAASQISRQSTSRPRPRASDPVGDYSLFNPSPTTVAIPNTPSSLLPPPKSNHSEKDDGGPHKTEMVARMEELQRGERILPPCDRCRRLHMDCLKNLTACMGCTKKHAKCSWRDVKDEELRETQSGSRLLHEVSADETKSNKDSTSASSTAAPVPVPATSAPAPAAAPALPGLLAMERDRSREGEHIGYWSMNARRESAPMAGHGHGPSMGTDPSPRRAMSETHGSAPSTHDRRVSLQRRTDTAPDDDDDDDDDDPDANQRLMQAIWDTVDHHTHGTGSVSEGKNETPQDRERERDHKMVKA